MGGLMEHGGMSRKTAAAWVADRLAAAGHRGLTPATITGWRKEALEKPQSMIAGRYAAVLTQADWAEPLARAEQLMGNLIVQFRPR